MAFASGASAAPLDGLTRAERDRIGERCLAVQYSDDADLLRNCLESEALASGAASSDAVAALDLDERYALAQRCAPDNEACRRRELEALARVPPPALESLRDDERHAVLRACYPVQGADGPAAWRRCASARAAELQRGAQVSLDALDLLERNALLNDCATDERQIGTYRNCLADGGATLLESNDTAALAATDLEAGPASSVLGATPMRSSSRQTHVPPLLAAEPGNAEPTMAQIVDGLPRVTELAGSERTPADDAPESSRRMARDAPQEDASDADTAGRAASANGLVARLGSSVSGLDTTGRMALLAAALLPLLLLVTRLIGRHRESLTTGPHGTRRNPVLAQRVRIDSAEPALDPTSSGPMTRDVRARFDRQADDLFDQFDATITEPVAEVEPVALDDDSRREPVPGYRPYGRPEPALETGSAHAPMPTAEPEPSVCNVTAELDDIEALAAIPANHDAPTVLMGRPPGHVADVESTRDEPASTQPVAAGGRAAPVSSFGRWLDAEPESQRLQHAIELLLYWIAYADERYEPALARAVLEDPHPDASVLIKRVVLQEDVQAFADTLRWMLGNTSIEQRRQTLELLIALLVTDAVASPVQNTLLRFIADAFGIGLDALKTLWQQSFAASLPGMSRVDRSDWWDSIDEKRLYEREARTLADSTPERQFAARLGLPLDAPNDPARIRAAYRLAVQRTEPGRFDSLGERERMLAARQLARFDEAHDALLEVTA